MWPAWRADRADTTFLELFFRYTWQIFNDQTSRSATKTFCFLFQQGRVVILTDLFSYKPKTQKFYFWNMRLKRPWYFKIGNRSFKMKKLMHNLLWFFFECDIFNRAYSKYIWNASAVEVIRIFFLSLLQLECPLKILSVKFVFVTQNIIWWWTEVIFKGSNVSKINWFSSYR